MFGKRGSIVPGKLLDDVTDHHQKLSEFEPPESIVNNNLPVLSWETVLLITKKAMIESGSLDQTDMSEVTRSFDRMLLRHDWSSLKTGTLEDYHFETFGTQENDEPIASEVSESILRMAEAFDPVDYPELFTNEVLEKAQRELDLCSNLVQSFNELETLYHNLRPYRGSLSAAINYIQNSEHVIDSEDTFI